MITDIQLIRRKIGIGGSDAAAVCGISKWKTPIDVYNDKITDEVIDINNKYVYWGNALEPIIVKEYENKTGKVVCTNNSLFVNDEHNFMIGNVDGYIPFDGGVLECKTADARTSKNWGEEGSDFFPEEYLIQCAHYSIVCDAPYVDLAVLIGGNDFRIYTYHRNQDLEELIIHEEKKFWNENVLKKIPPPPRTEDDLNKIIKVTTGNMKLAPPSIKSMLTILSDTDKKIKELQYKKDELSFVIKKTISDYDGMVDEFGNQLCTWKIQESKRFDITKFKNEHPDIYNKFTNVSKSRVFRIRRD